MQARISKQRATSSSLSSSSSLRLFRPKRATAGRNEPVITLAAAPHDGGHQRRRHQLLIPKPTPTTLSPLRRRRSTPSSSAVVAARASSSSSSSSPLSSLSRTLSNFFKQNYLPLSLIAGMIIGFYFPGPGNAAADLGATSFATAGIFLISGLSLKKEEALGALKSWKEVLFGLVSILLITPVIAAPIAAALPLEPAALATGLAVFFCMPTTLSSGVALTSAAGGDSALALLLTVSSNLLGVVTAPWAVAALLGSGGGILGGAKAAAAATSSTLSIDPVPLLRALAVSVAAPLVLGAVLRSLPFGKGKRWFAKIADDNKRRLSYLSAALLATVPWCQVSRAVASEAAGKSPSALPPAGPLAVAAAAGLAIHSLLLLFNYLAVVKVLKLGGGSSGKRAQQLALVLCSSQKTLTVAVPALAALCASTKNGAAFAATAMMPVVLVHMLQTALDGFLVTRASFAGAGGGKGDYVMYRF